MREFGGLPRRQKQICEELAQMLTKVRDHRQAEDAELLQHALSAHDDAQKQMAKENGHVNHMDTTRFDAADVADMSTRFSKMFSDPDKRRQILEARYDAPMPPSLGEQSVFLHAARQVTPDRTGVIFDWVRVVCRCRDRFKDAILFKSWDGSCSVAYKLLFAKCQPLLAVFVRLERAPVVLPKFSASSWSFVRGRPNRCEFICKPYTFFSDESLQWTDHDELWVLRNATFEGNKVVAPTAPEPWEAFVSPFRALAAKEGEATRGQQTYKKHIPETERQALRAEFEWLTDADFLKMQRPPCLKRTSASVADGAPGAAAADDSASDSSASDDEREVLDDEDVPEALRKLRLQYCGDDEHESFVIKLLGGKWTKKHLGVVADAACCVAVGAIAQHWCDGYLIQRRYVFTFKTYTREGSLMLAREMCRRLQFYLDVFCAQEDEDFLYSQEQLDSYTEDPKFTQLMRQWPSKSSFHKRGLRIRSTVPDNGPCSEDEG